MDPRKLEALTRVSEAEAAEGVIIFARTPKASLAVSEALEAMATTWPSLNGERAPEQRERTVEMAAQRSR